MIDRKTFFEGVRASLFAGNLTQSQVDGMNYLLDIWEMYFEKENPRDGNVWLAYCMATVFHETARTMQPIEEYGKGKGKPYGVPVGPYGQIYYGRGHVQLTWEDNYKKGQQRLDQVYNVIAELHPKPQLMLQNEISALVLYDGMSAGWFTGVGLPKYFNSTTEDPVNARRIVNGTDQASTIAGYYSKFKASIVTLPDHEIVPEPEPEPAPEPGPAPPAPPTITISSDAPVWIRLGENVFLVQ
jgi:putative chitinase